MPNGFQEQHDVRMVAALLFRLISDFEASTGEIWAGRDDQYEQLAAQVRQRNLS